MSTSDLFLALIILTCIILVLILVYFLHYCFKRDQHKRQKLLQQEPQHRHHSHDDIETGLPLPLYAHKVDIERPDIQHPYEDRDGDGLQRLSRLTTVAPSMELLPQIRTSGSSERAEDWLERRQSRVVDGNGKVAAKSGVMKKEKGVEAEKANAMVGEKDVIETKSGIEK
ncbi:hypothetical protein FB567DRAFT_602572 [Paraphoma chrysanthemicola]|uniref:Uncharacterized protein n=1 Tax=Paraphoma chrysanthemicola TaxID=798071 RepID=A0A8K0VZ17_9PLEO|nr:hypothetical protein FB567DRAFT_602572 [Paraphoma chrysanthemicola]